MKRIVGFLMAATLLLLGLAATQASAKPHDEYSGNVGIFYRSLSPYGEWVNADIGFGWRPINVGHHWRPYLHGRWVWTDYGWYWVSDEPFGWATFHYGRWFYDDYYGWIWIPDRVWGPAWVEWRYDNDYVGWAPLPPYAQFVVEIGLRWSTHWAAPVHYWNFVPCRRFATTNIADHIVPVERARRIFGNTRGGEMVRLDRERVVNRGVEPRFIERRGEVRITRADVIDRNDPREDRLVRGDRRTTIEAYRPKIEDRTRDEGAPQPGVRERGRSNDAGREATLPQWRGDARSRDEQRKIEERRGNGEYQREIEQRRGNGEYQREIERRREERQREQQSQRQSYQQERAQPPAVQQAPRQERGRERSVERTPQQSGRSRDQGRGAAQQREERPRGRRPM